MAPQMHRRWPALAGWLLALLPLGLLAYFAALAREVMAGNALASSYRWIPGLGVELALRLDGLSLLFALLITGIGALVFIYTGAYLAGDPMVGRLYTLLLIFMASMLGLVLSDNLLGLFVFWELTTVSSYMLIGYKHRYEKARKAALQGLLVTGAGGLALLAGIVLLGQIAGTLQISALAGQAAAIQAHPLYGTMLACVLLGAFTKSAQFPFHFWLLGAMEAPTPVSSYLHSATMVKAGVFLLARLNPALGGTAAWQTTLTLVGLVTLVVSMVMAVLQTDLKRILAYTTVAALGTLVLLLGVGTEDAVKAAMVFILVHALYKGALFMVAGSVDHETGTRDIRLLGGLRGAMPLTAAAGALAALSMAGVPLLFGFVAKELIYKSLVPQPAVLWLTVLANVLLFAAAGLVAAQVFFGRRPVEPTPKRPREAPLAMLLGPGLLAGLGVVLGVLPQLADGLMSGAVSAGLGVPKSVELHLLPELEGPALVALGLSGLTIALGVALYLARGVLPRLAERLAVPLSYGPERGYYALLDGTLGFARLQTRLLQNGYLRYYLIMIIVTAVGLTGYALLARVPLGIPPLTGVRVHEAIFALLIVVATVVVLRARSRLTAVISLGVVGYSMAMTFIFYGGPDLAMTQFAIETLSVVLFVFVLYRLPRFTNLSSRAARIRDMLVAGSAGLLMTTITLAVLTAPGESRLERYFAESSYTLANGLNVVNVILVDFRGVDTMGEITVLAMAAIGIYALIRLRVPDEEEQVQSDMDLAERTAQERPPSEAALPPGEELIDVEHTDVLVATATHGAREPDDERLLAELLASREPEERRWPR